MNKITLTAVC